MEKAGERKGGQGGGQNWAQLRTEWIREAVPRSCLVLLSTAHWDIQLSIELQNIISHICSLRVTFLCFTNSLNFSRWFSDMFKGNVYEWTWTTIVHVNGSSCSEKWQTILVHSWVFKPFYSTGTTGNPDTAQNASMRVCSLTLRSTFFSWFPPCFTLFRFGLNFLKI